MEMKFKVKTKIDMELLLIILMFFFVPYTKYRLGGFKISEILGMLLVVFLFLKDRKILIKKNIMLDFVFLFTISIILSALLSYFDPINKYVHGENQGIFYSFECGWILKLIRMYIIFFIYSIVLKKIKNYSVIKTIFYAYILSCVILDFFGIIEALKNGGFQIIGIYRTSLCAQEPSEAGFINCFAIILCLYLCLSEKRKKYYIELAILVLGQVVIGSTASLIALIMGISFEVAYILLKKNIKIIYKIAIVLCCIIVSIYAGNFLFNKTQIFNKLINFDYYTTIEGSSISERITTIQTCWQMFLKRPLFGVGFGNFGWYIDKFITSTYLRYIPGGSFQPNNLYFQILAELGVIGIAILVGYFINIMRKIIKIIKYNKNNNMGYFLFAMWIYIMIHNLTLTTFFSFQFWLMTILVIYMDKDEN